MTRRGQISTFTWCPRRIFDAVTHPVGVDAERMFCSPCRRGRGDVTTGTGLAPFRRRIQHRHVDAANIGNPVTNFVFLPTAAPMVAISKCGNMARGNPGRGQRRRDGDRTTGTPLDPRVLQRDRGLLGIDVRRTTPDGRHLLALRLRGRHRRPVGVQRAGKPTGKLSHGEQHRTRLPDSCRTRRSRRARRPAVVLGQPGRHRDDSHTIGTVLAAADRTLFVGVGDGSSYGGPDGSAPLAQDLTSPRGKIFHIDANGSGLTANPFYNGDATTGSSGCTPTACATRSASPHPHAPTPDRRVGWNTWEEIDIAHGGENFGWPCWEGNAKQSGYQDLARARRCTPAAATRSPSTRGPTPAAARRR